MPAGSLSFFLPRMFLGSAAKGGFPFPTPIRSSLPAVFFLGNSSPTYYFRCFFHEEIASDEFSKLSLSIVCIKPLPHDTTVVFSPPSPPSPVFIISAAVIQPGILSTLRWAFLHIGAVVYIGFPSKIRRPCFFSLMFPTPPIFQNLSFFLLQPQNGSLTPAVRQGGPGPKRAFPPRFQAVFFCQFFLAKGRIMSNAGSTSFVPSFPFFEQRFSTSLSPRTVVRPWSCGFLSFPFWGFRRAGFTDWSLSFLSLGPNPLPLVAGQFPVSATTLYVGPLPTYMRASFLALTWGVFSRFPTNPVVYLVFVFIFFSTPVLRPL